MNKYQEAKLVQAIQYARRGWRVLPSGFNKKPLIANWTAEATTDAEKIMGWWEQYPSANISIATGKETGFFVVDVDMKSGNDGIETLKRCFGDKFELFEEQLIARTPSGGFHFLYNCGDLDVKTTSNVLPGIDLRGEGGQILVAPSAVKMGDKYEEYRWNDLKKVIIDPPEWVQELVKMAGTSQHGKADLTTAINGIGKGDRDSSIFSLACLMEREGIDIDVAKGFIKAVAERCSPPFNEREAVEKVEHAYKNYATKQGLERRMDAVKKKLKELESNG